jgi:ParB family chromosome partitioning protein
MAECFDLPAVVRPAVDLAALAAEINAAHDRGDEHARRRLEDYRHAGALLLKAKKSMPRGQWLTWLQKNVRFSGSRARHLMQWAESLVTIGSAGAEAEWRRISGNGPHVAHNSGENEWYTPPAYIAAAREVLGAIDLDPASSAKANETVGAARYFTREDSGLLKPWGGRVWMNPPYESALVGQFVSKLCEHVASGDVTSAILLVNNGTETTWFQDGMNLAKAVCFPAGRVKFLDEEGKPGAPLQGQALLYFGPDSQAFLEVFGRFGSRARIV